MKKVKQDSVPKDPTIKSIESLRRSLNDKFSKIIRRDENIGHELKDSNSKYQSVSRELELLKKQKESEEASIDRLSDLVELLVDFDPEKYQQAVDSVNRYDILVDRNTRLCNDYARLNYFSCSVFGKIEKIRLVALSAYEVIPCDIKFKLDLIISELDALKNDILGLQKTTFKDLDSKFYDDENPKELRIGIFAKLFLKIRGILS